MKNEYANYNALSLFVVGFNDVISFPFELQASIRIGLWLQTQTQLQLQLHLDKMISRLLHLIGKSSESNENQTKVIDLICMRWNDGIFIAIRLNDDI